MKMLGTILESHAATGKKLTVRKISVDRNEPAEVAPIPIQDYVVVEGDRDSLRFLGELFIAFADNDLGCSFDLHPQGAGNAHFSDTSDMGIKLHKMPCDLV
jgi:hypothetical protein